MVLLAPRLGPRLLLAIDRIDDGRLPVAEIWRRVRAEAAALGVPSPSYERVRTIVRAQRRLRARRTSTASVAVGIALRSLPPEALLAHLAGRT